MDVEINVQRRLKHLWYQFFAPSALVRGAVGVMDGADERCRSASASGVSAPLNHVSSLS